MQWRLLEMSLFSVIFFNSMMLTRSVIVRCGLFSYSWVYNNAFSKGHSFITQPWPLFKHYCNNLKTLALLISVIFYYIPLFSNLKIYSNPTFISHLGIRQTLDICRRYTYRELQKAKLPKSCDRKTSLPLLASTHSHRV